MNMSKHHLFKSLYLSRPLYLTILVLKRLECTSKLRNLKKKEKFCLVIALTGASHVCIIKITFIFESHNTLLQLKKHIRFYRLSLFLVFLKKLLTY